MRTRLGVVILASCLAVPSLSQGAEGPERSDGRADALDETRTSTVPALETSTATAAPPLEEPLPPEMPPPKLIETSTAGAPAEDAPPPSAAWWRGAPTQLGPAEIDVGVGRIRLGLGTQLRVQISSLEADTDSGLETAVLVPRLRSSLSGRFLDDRLSFAVQINTTAGNFELVDVYIDFEIFRELRFRVGQFKIPFDAYRQQSFSRLLLADWAVTTAWFGAERQFGMMVHDEESGPGLDYSLGLFTGQNRRASHAVRLPDLYGEPISNPSQVDGVGEVDVIHPEIVGSLRYATRGFSSASISDAAGGPLRARFALGGALDARPEEARDFRARVSAESWLKLHHVSVLVIGYVGLTDPVTTDGPILGATGLNAETGYRFHPNLEVAVRYARVQLSGAQSDDAQDRGQAIIDDATSPDETAELEAQYARAGQLRSEHELLGGFTFFFVGHSLKLQLDAGWIRQSLRDGDEDGFRLRTHLQLAF